MDSIRLGSSNYIELADFKDELTNVPITTATVTARLYDESTGLQVGVTIAMPHIGTGTYRGSIAYDHAGLYAGMQLRCEIFADGGTGKRLLLKRKVTVISDS